MSNVPSVVAILGPTAVGKTALSLQLATRYHGEIISADSRQIYRGMDIGTAKATARVRTLVPHHLIDVVAPDAWLSLAQYKALASAAIDDIWSRGRVPFLVGGTGLYVRALLEGWTVPEVPPNEELRQRLYARAEREGAASLHSELARLDPTAAGAIDARNVRRVIRALEVCLETGSPISTQQSKVAPAYRVLRLGLTLPREALYSRIDARIDGMLAAGLVDEVRGLLLRGYGLDLPSMSGLGYRQIAVHLQGDCSLDEAVVQIKRHTRRFVRQQYNWFRLDDGDITWLDADGRAEGRASALIGAFLDQETT
jgi:tRNA dimethylallyltransferase